MHSKNRGDIWHYLHRIYAVMGCNNGSYHAKLEFRDIFYADGARHNAYTASPVLIEFNLNQWISKYKNSSWFNKKIQNKCEKLRVHIRKGCCSYIPPFFGSNHNELSHSWINNLVGSISSIGAELAEAILVPFFHQHNDNQPYHINLVT